MTPDRLALLVNADGRRLVLSIQDTGHPPKTKVHNGSAYTLLMTMAVEHREIATAWATRPLGTAKVSVDSSVRRR
jgi:hypothetical protein